MHLQVSARSEAEADGLDQEAAQSSRFSNSVLLHFLHFWRSDVYSYNSSSVVVLVRILSVRLGIFGYAEA